MNQVELQRRAEKALSSYDGGVYDGGNDDLVQFSGAANSFNDEGKKDLNYSMTITNQGTAAEDQVIAICPGYFALAADIKDAQGDAVAGIALDGDIVATAGKEVVGKGSPKKIDEFLAFIKNNPTRFIGMKMLVDDAEQFEEEIYIKKISPFRNLEDRQIIPSHYKDSSQLDDKRVEIPLEDFQLDNQTIVLMKIKAGRRVTINFFAGSILNTAAALDVKAKKARLGLSRGF